MDADEFEPVFSDIGEAMRHAGRCNDDVSGRGARRFISNDELGLAALDHPGLRIGMHMQA